MKKIYSILIISLSLLSVSLTAQTKLGHLNVQEIMLLMPERAAAEEKMQTLNTALETRLQVLSTEYQKQITEFNALPDDTPPSTANDMRDSILELEKRIQEFQVNAERDLMAKQQELLNPMLEKLRTAIDAIGAENGFIYIFDSSSDAMVYKNGEDVSALVKAKLGITG